jgi:hypothetical protein
MYGVMIHKIQIVNQDESNGYDIRSLQDRYIHNENTLAFWHLRVESTDNTPPIAQLLKLVFQILDL